MTAQSGSNVGWPEAVSSGAQVLVGGQQWGTTYSPTILVDTRATMRVNCEEILAPVVGGTPYEDVGKAIRGVDTSAYGLQAGTSTNDVCVISKAFQEPEVGGLSVNEVLTWRIDHVPYGRVMQSGFRREGIRYAIEEMTELKMLMLHIG